MLKQITIELLDDCTQRCSFCSSFAINGGNVELPYASVEKALLEAKEMGLETVAFSGGEPLLYHQIEPCIKLASSLGLKTYLYTSGNLRSNDRTLRPIRNEEALHLKDAGLYYVYVSIYGNNKITHQKLCQTKGSFETAIQSLQTLISAGFNVGVHYLVTKINYSELSSTADFLFSLGISDFKPMKLVVQGRAQKTEDALILYHSEYRDFYDQLRNIVSRYGSRISLGCFWKNTLLLDELGITLPQCKVGKSVVTLKSDGTVVPCGANKFMTLGDINETSLTEIWNSRITKTFHPC